MGALSFLEAQGKYKHRDSLITPPAFTPTPPTLWNWVIYQRMHTRAENKYTPDAPTIIVISSFSLSS